MYDKTEVPDALKAPKKRWALQTASEAQKKESALQTELLNKILKELTILNNNLEKIPSMYSMPPTAPRNPNPLNILNKFDFDFEKLSAIAILLLELYKKEDKE
jgi:hypothetical protein